MKIEIKDIKSTARVLKELKFSPLIDRSELFFPISTAAEKEFDGLTMSTKQTASRSVLIPGLILTEVFDEKNNKSYMDVKIAYADSRFCPEFDPVQFADILGQNLSRKTREFLDDKECYLVEKEYIKAVYKL